MDDLKAKAHRQIGIWLLLVCAVIFLIVILGGATRLTGSGLSMTQLRVVMGVIPPMSEQEWKETFEHYKNFPEYEISYKDKMDLNGFKKIFWLEFIHRFVARFLASFLFLIPLIYFIVQYFIRKKVISAGLIGKILFMFALGGLQAALGWAMVKSGMNKETAHIIGRDVHVSHFFLTAHLVLAMVTFAYILWIALSLLKKDDEVNENPILKKMAYIYTILIFITIASGGFVAGIRAGMFYQTFPLMNDRFIPESAELFRLEPFFLNFFSSEALVQFDHRILAYCVFILILVSWVIAVKTKNGISKRIRSYMNVLMGMAVVQLTLGVLTLLTFIPKANKTIILGTAHQGGAVILFSLAIVVLHGFIKSNKTSRS